MSDPREWTPVDGAREWVRLGERLRPQIIEETPLFQMYQVGGYALAAFRRALDDLAEGILLRMGHNTDEAHTAGMRMALGLFVTPPGDETAIDLYLARRAADLHTQLSEELGDD